MKNNEGNSEIKLWKTTDSKMHWKPLNSSALSGRQSQKTMMFPTSSA